MEPGAGNAAYLALCKEEAEREGKPMEPLADLSDEDPALALMDGDVDSDEDDDIGVPLVPDPPKPQRRRAPAPPVSSGGGGASGSGGPGGAAPPPLAGPPAPHIDSDSDVSVRLTPPDDGGGDGDGGYGGGGDGNDGDVGVDFDGRQTAPRARREDAPEFFVGMDGFEVKYDAAYVHPVLKTRLSPNWKIRCRNPDHPKSCKQSKHVFAASTKRFGEVEVLAFLHAWADTPPAPGKSHSLADPKPEAVASVAAERRELEEVIHRGHGH